MTTTGVTKDTVRALLAISQKYCLPLTLSFLPGATLLCHLYSTRTHESFPLLMGRSQRHVAFVSKKGSRPHHLFVDSRTAAMLQRVLTSQPLESSPRNISLYSNTNLHSCPTLSQQFFFCRDLLVESVFVLTGRRSVHCY